MDVALKGLRTAALLVLLSSLVAIVPNVHAEPTSAEDRARSWKQHQQLRQESIFKHLSWRSVGPRKQGGRIETIAVHPDNTSTIYLGIGTGGIWKTNNNGTTWKPIFDDQSTSSIGDIAIAPSDQDVLWVGTGEELMARSSFAGTGVFKSTDAGHSWTHMGLEDTHHIGRVIIHPQNPDIVYVAAIGHLYSDNQQRGVFKTTDGGSTWKRVLFVDSKSGAIDLEIDPSDPKVLYATTWQHERRAWGHNAFGPGSRIYKSTDAGEHWKQLDNGLPTGGSVGRIAIDIARSNPSILYALVNRNGKKGKNALYRSDDRGESWRQVNEQEVRAGYDFCMVRISPDDPDEVYLPGQRCYVSSDGGKTFRQVQGTLIHLLRHGSRILHLDAHAFWINPNNADHVLLGNDGGFHISYDRCETWLHLNNLPIGEFYAVWADNSEPYNIFGGTQDNAALFGPSNHIPADDAQDAWEHVYLDRWGGGDSYFTYSDPADPQTVYYEHQFGDLRRKNMGTGKTLGIRPRAESITDYKPDDPKLRFNWMTPFILSHYDSSTLYYGANKLFKSTNRGDDWTVISPDLSTGPGPNQQGNVPYGTITTVSESKLVAGLLYAGTDDGNVHVTQDDGRTWNLVSEALPDHWVSRVVASKHSKSTVYVTLTGYREDDFTTHVFRSTDYGKNWQSIKGNLPDEPVNVIREDPEEAAILYLGTDVGAYVSINHGEQWQVLGNGLPTIPVHDLFVHPRDGELIAGTHGRSIYVLDVGPVRRLQAVQKLETAAEASDYRATASSEAVVEFVDSVAAHCEHIHRFEFGRTFEDRPMVGAIVANPPVADSATISDDDRLVVLINGNIHSGECCGKEAMLRMLRELATQPDHPWLKRLILLVVPNYNADGNDRLGKDNRPGQIGPVDGMGQRANAQNLDLNRDYMKLESPEAQALVALMNRWNIDCFLDLHTTNGSWHQYQLTYDVQHNPAADSGLGRFLRNVMMPKVTEQMSARNYNTFYYGNFNRDNSRWSTADHKPRFGMDYAALRGHISILSEAYSYIPFRERIEVTHAFVGQCLDFLTEYSDAVTEVLAAVRSRALKPPQKREPSESVPIRARMAPFKQLFTVKGFHPPSKPRVRQAEIVHGLAATPPGQPRDYTVQFYGRFEPTLSVARPSAYLIPADQAKVVAKLRQHGAIMEQLPETAKLEVEVYRWKSLEQAKDEFQGHRIATAEVTSHTETREIAAGTYRIKTAQPLGTLIVYLLEPQSDDGLVAWNYLDEQFAPGTDYPILRVK